MSLVEQNQKLGGYEASDRTMRLHLSELTVSRSWYPEDPFSEQLREPEPAVEMAISGTADLGKCSIAVVGSDRPPVRRFSFSISPAKQTEANGRWARIKAIRGDWFAELLREDPDHPDQARLVQYLRNHYDQFDERGPTARLYYRTAYWETGCQEGWEGSCEISPHVFDALVADIHADRCTHVTIGLNLQPTLSDSEHAPPSVPVTFGVLSHGRHDGGTNDGWVSSISWTTTGGHDNGLGTLGVTHDAPHAEVDVVRTSQETRDPASGVAVLEESNRAISRLAGSVRTGFVLLLVLIALSVLFR